MAAAILQLGMSPRANTLPPSGGGKASRDKKDCEYPKRFGAKPMFQQEVCGSVFQRQALVYRLLEAGVLKSFGH